MLASTCFFPLLLMEYLLLIYKLSFAPLAMTAEGNCGAHCRFPLEPPFFTQEEACETSLERGSFVSFQSISEASCSLLQPFFLKNKRLHFGICSFDAIRNFVGCEGFPSSWQSSRHVCRMRGYDLPWVQAILGLVSRHCLGLRPSYSPLLAARL